MKKNIVIAALILVSFICFIYGYFQSAAAAKSREMAEFNAAIAVQERKVADEQTAIAKREALVAKAARIDAEIKRKALEDLLQKCKGHK